MAEQVTSIGRSVKSAERALDLLETIGASPEGMTFSRLLDVLGIPKSSLHALLHVLARRGYVELDPESRHFTLGVRVWETGFAYHRHHGFLQETRATMEAIVEQVNETVQLAKLSGSENVYLDKVDSSHALRLQSEIGTRLPAHATGVGKALLAQLEAEEVMERFPGSSLEKYTSGTIGSVSELLDEIALIRIRGFAIDNEEYTPGIFCFAVPVYEAGPRATTAMSVSVPTTRIARHVLPNILVALARGSIEITQRVGHRQPDRLLMTLTDPANATARVDEALDSGRYSISFA